VVPYIGFEHHPAPTAERTNYYLQPFTSKQDPQARPAVADVQGEQAVLQPKVFAAF
jgi:hypothetical protein